ncbi:MAG: molybdopterin-dependent oxidoreductase [Actinomycetota bacterium]|nr:molybdopterin-dependent oxidoreductase [Actinomycetota bacterium]MDH5223362.1 molybdopterin-dependent oxidoreductase [Actinomycetota bacterium]MDH5312435.1 molybdopterin-dependent oxidoreductase [Actinomycetota bacterium]
MRIRVGTVLGLASAAAALGVAHLLAGLVGRAESSPVLAVGSATIDLVPRWLKEFAIDTFGTADKLVLLIGIVVVVAVLAVVVGVASVRRPEIGFASLALAGAIGVIAALSRPSAQPIDALPALVGAAAGAMTLRLLHRRLFGQASNTESDRIAPTSLDGVSRRRFLAGGAVALGVAAAAGVTGQFLSRRSQAVASRARVGVPSTVASAAPVPAGAELGIDGLSPFTTPNADFYRIDTALLVPTMTAEEWRLRVHGMVDQELTIDFEQLQARPLIERDVTLACVSNEVGGDLIGNARWVGAPIADVLADVGVDPAATQLVSTSVDGFTVGTPVSALTDGRDAMLAFAMNGEPLPIEHGFPVRMVVPGLYGYVSATKWVVDFELTTFEAFDPYWVRRGWAEQAPIKTQSRIDTPRSGGQVQAGEVVVAGMAWAQHVGIARVEVRADDGEWAEAELAEEDTIDTWRQWKLTIRLGRGARRLQVRATDAEGVTQPESRAEPFPDGAAGWHSVLIDVA